MECTVQEIKFIYIFIYLFDMLLHPKAAKQSYYDTIDTTKIDHWSVTSTMRTTELYSIITLFGGFLETNKHQSHERQRQTISAKTADCLSNNSIIVRRSSVEDILMLLLYLAFKTQ